MTDLKRRHLLAGAAAVGAAAVTGLRPIATNASVPQSGAQAPGFYRYKVGSYECTSINDGARSFPMPDKFVVNIVRSKEQADILHKIGAKHVVDSSAPSFLGDLTNALVETGATIAFDAIGGGKLAGDILNCMEVAINKTAKEYSRYGSNVHKQVYVYGGLDIRPIELPRGFGMAWGVGGWLLFPFLMKIGQADGAKLRQRVVDELKTTFASHYTKVVSLPEALDPANIAVYAKRATGEKFLINPNKLS